MSLIWVADKAYRRVEYENEADLESAIVQVQHRLFGPKRFYLDVKSKIGAKGSMQNIPDGYLLDLSTAKPRLWVVENELQAHDPLRHIAVQILQFSLSFEGERLGVKKVLVRALQSRPDLRKVCEEYAASREFRNFDHLLEYLVESPFSALVIIDSVPENLETVLSKKFNFGVEVLELERYESEDGERAYLGICKTRHIHSTLKLDSCWGYYVDHLKISRELHAIRTHHRELEAGQEPGIAVS